MKRFSETKHTVAMIISILAVFTSFLVKNQATAFVAHPTFLSRKTSIRGPPSSSSTHTLRAASNVTTFEESGKGELQVKRSKLKKTMPKHEIDGPVMPIHSIAEFLHEIESAPQNGIVVVQYHAKWCKVCARVVIKMRQMAQRLLSKDLPVPVSFLSVEVTANNEICSTLEIKKFPFVQMYRNNECVASFGTGPAHNFQRAVGQTLDEKLSLTEQQWDSFRSEFKKEIAGGLAQIESLRLSQFYDGDGTYQTIDEEVAP